MKKYLIIGILVLTGFNPVFGNSSLTVSIDEEGDGRFRVEGVFEAPVTPAEAWSILSDYNRIDEFISFVEESRIIEKDGGVQFLEQLAKSRFLFFSKKIRVVLKIEEEKPRKIVFEDVAHHDFSFYRGQWLLEEIEKGTRLTYTLAAHIKFFAPGFIARGVMEKNVRSYLEELAEEISVHYPQISSPDQAQAKQRAEADL